MKHYLACLIMFCMAFIGFSPLAQAIEAADQAKVEDQAPKKTRAKMLTGTPVHTGIAGGGSLPKGKLLTIYNFSLADKTNAKNGYKGSDIYSQAHLLKIRYGLTNHWEIITTGAYINNGRRDPSQNPGHIEGIGDQSLGITYAPLQFHQGDPVALSFNGAISMPTAPYGKNHVPGNGVWGSRLAAGFATFLTDDIRFDIEGCWTTSFERGNQKVRKGDQYQWNTMVRYLFDWFDIGIESVYVHTENGDKITPAGNKINMYNGGKEWHVGPTTSIAIDALDMWVGAGVYFPVMQDMNGATAVDDVQYHFKIGKMW